jgi:hypothetical protein
MSTARNTDSPPVVVDAVQAFPGANPDRAVAALAQYRDVSNERVVFR